MIVGIVRETFSGERRVAVAPAAVTQLKRKKIDVVIESGAGRPAAFTDEAYKRAGATIVSSRAEVFEQADAICQVRAPSANAEGGDEDAALLRRGQTVIGLCDPLGSGERVEALAATGAQVFALELLPRITRAQSMDVLSSQAFVAGYRAVILAASELPKMFPLSMTAAGTLTPARIFVIGAGVAGLQAIATAKRLGAVVTAYDIRPAVREQVESVGGKFLEIVLSTSDAEGKGGYARAMDDTFYRQQRELMHKAVAESDVIITTAAVPGRTSPVLVTADMIQHMAPGSVIVDLAAERGGNCELTRADERVVANDVTILGPTNLPAGAPYHASQMYARNIYEFLAFLTKEGELAVDDSDEIVSATLLARDGEIVQPRVREHHGLSSLPEAAAATATEGSSND